MIHSTISYKHPKCDLYTMEYISKLPIHFSKGIIKCVLNCANFPGGRLMDKCSRKTVHHFNTNTTTLVIVLTNKRGNKNHSPKF